VLLRRRDIRAVNSLRNIPGSAALAYSSRLMGETENYRGVLNKL
jgi:hypothetical protein